MNRVAFEGKVYDLDPLGHLDDPRDWDEDFARGMAPEVGIAGGLTEEHWKVLRYLRRVAEETGRSPVVYQTCKANGLQLKQLQDLFPAGYQRGACRLAGLGVIDGDWGVVPSVATRKEALRREAESKVYRVDARGFLVDHEEWDEQYATMKAAELGVPGGLSERHWQFIRYLREAYARLHEVPTVYEACEKNRMALEELARLFPSGYHRGAVKIAGLRLAPPGSGGSSNP
jgi:tRNA 2-thiouridine synthesizing protein E